MPRLTEPMQRFVIRCKARFISDKDIIAALQEEYGKKVDGLTRQNLEVYDPKCAAFLRLSDDLKQFFLDERKVAESEVSLVPISSQAYRLWKLTAIVENEDHSENPFLVAKILEQAAKEMGGMYHATVTKAPTGSGALSGGTSGAGSDDPDRAAAINSVLNDIRARAAGETPIERVPGDNAQPGASGGDTKEVL